MVDGVSHSLEFHWVELLLKQLKLAFLYLQIFIEETFIRWRSGDRIPLETRSSTRVQICPGAHQASYVQWVRARSPG